MKQNNKHANAVIVKRSKNEIAETKLPPIATIFEQKERGEITTNESIIKIRDWFTVYFTKVFRTFNREMVGKKISPGDWHMDAAIELLVAGAHELEPRERAKSFIALETLLSEIANAWQDAAAPALSALYHWRAIKEFIVHQKADLITERVKHQIITPWDEKEWDGYCQHFDELKADLNKLSQALLGAINTNGGALMDELKKIRTDIKDVRINTKIAADKASIAADQARQANKTSTAVAISLADRWDGFERALRASGAFPKKKTTLQEKNAIIKLWDQYSKGKLTAEIARQNDIDPSDINCHSVECFLDYCATMTLPSDDLDPSIVKCLGEVITRPAEMKALLHSRASNKYNHKEQKPKPPKKRQIKKA